MIINTELGKQLKALWGAGVIEDIRQEQRGMEVGFFREQVPLSPPSLLRAMLVAALPLLLLPLIQNQGLTETERFVWFLASVILLAILYPYIGALIRPANNTEENPLRHHP